MRKLGVALALFLFIFLLSPEISAQTPVRFAVIGDYGVENSSLDKLAVADMVLSWEPEFIVTLGDNNALGPLWWDEAVGPYEDYIESGCGFYPCIGNHDEYDDGVLSYTAYFDLPGNERYYDVDRGLVHLFCVNCVLDPDGVTWNSVQANWLNAELSESTSVWNIVYFHYPPYTSDTYHGPTLGMRWGFEGADIVLSGHTHVYERLFVKGLTYITGLPGGQTPRNFFGDFVGGSVCFWAGSYGAMLVEASDKRITFSSYTVSAYLVESYTMAKE